MLRANVQGISRPDRPSHHDFQVGKYVQDAWGRAWGSFGNMELTTFLVLQSLCYLKMCPPPGNSTWKLKILPENENSLFR